MRIIDADALKEDFRWSEVCRLSILEIIQMINDAPTVEERPQGKWILCNDTYFSKCSICGDIWLNEECKNYCPNCGADMRGMDNDKK